MRLLTDTFKLISDPSRIRILMLLDKRELCVCQLTASLGLAQSLVSHNLSNLRRAGFLDVRKDGKMIFYRLKKKLSRPKTCLMDIVRECLRNNPDLKKDLRNLSECTEFQKKSGKCDTVALAKFMSSRRKAKK
jgi:ArsR family transcriptional regulator, arsenate/arsenite/antimonite-responsive transcriptional repressor